MMKWTIKNGDWKIKPSPTVSFESLKSKNENLDKGICDLKKVIEKFLEEKRNF